MGTVIRSGRFYFWPIITANVITLAARQEVSLFHAMLFAIVIALLASFGFVLNDLWDRDVDRVNRANHFEYSSKETILLGVSAAILFSLSALVLSFYLGRAELGVALAILLGLITYTTLARRILCIPNVLAAILAAAPVWAPLLLWSRHIVISQIVFVVAMILLIVSREMFMDIRDREGDFVGRRQTVATIFGIRRARLAAFILSITGAILLVAAIGIAVHVATPAVQVVGWLSGFAVIFVVLRSAFDAWSSEEVNTSIQRYVLRTRFVMMVLPIINVLMWH